MLKVNEVNHPLVAYYLTILRDKATGKAQFKSSLEKISYILAVDVFSKLNSEAKIVETPLMKAKGSKIKNKVVLLPILRAGLGMTAGFTELYPEIIVSHIGLYRDEENLRPVKYYFKFPQIKDKEHLKVIIVDPMVATGGSVIFTIEYLLSMGIKNISIVSLISAPEGINSIDKRFSAQEKENMSFYTCKIDDKLNNKGYILPGLGDAGDRMFGT
ncbi:MAG: uracil phosphoribosyltransferase [Ignavibacteria bacterium]|nr:uracil phosphoribosyltransferase [Ignavibacteria bacterium]